MLVASGPAWDDIMNSIRGHMRAILSSPDPPSGLSTRLYEQLEQEMGLAPELLGRVGLKRPIFKLAHEIEREIAQEIAQEIELEQRAAASRVREARSGERPAIREVCEPGSPRLWSHYESMVSMLPPCAQEIESIFPGTAAEAEEWVWQKTTRWEDYVGLLACQAGAVGDPDCLRALHARGGEAALNKVRQVTLSDAEFDDLCPRMHSPAAVTDCFIPSGLDRLRIRILGDMSPAHAAIRRGHGDFLRVLHELGGDAALTRVSNYMGMTPADEAATRGNASCLRVLAELAGLKAIDTTEQADEAKTPAHLAAESGHAECLRVIHELGASTFWKGELNACPAHLAALNGHAECLRVLHGFGGEAAKSLSARDVYNRTTVHHAAIEGHEDCLRLLHELGGDFDARSPLWIAEAESDNEDECTPAILAARNGHEGCLRFLHELGGIAAASLFTMTDEAEHTPALNAARFGHLGCLRALHELACKSFDPLIAHLTASDVPALAAQSIASSLTELRALKALSWTQATAPYDEFLTTRGSPAMFASLRGHVDCLRFLIEIGGAEPFLAYVRRDPHDVPASLFEGLLADSSFLDLATKRAWLDARLSEKVDDDDDFDASLNLEVHRGSVLEGVCAQLGVEEQTGRVQAEARGVRVTFQGEAADGDALRREWLGAASAEMIDPAYGLFLSRDGGRTLQPNPESGSTHGPDHLSYFALLGRIAGLALYHREQLDVAWSPAFLKAVLGLPMTVEDVASADPEAGDNLRKMRGYTAEELEACGVTFEIDADESVVYDDSAKRRRTSIELKPGGAEIEVTRDNLEEYLALYAHHRLVKSIEEQVGAVRDGLGVFVDDDVRATLRSCCTVAEFQLLLCGTKEIDVDDWQRSAQYGGGYAAETDQVVWFWAEVRAMTQEEQSKLLHFCTGSVRAPATGFSGLMGYQGQQQRFTIQRDPRGAERLPVASACFNKLLLPAYASRETLAAKLRLAISLSEGFHEAAVAVGEE